MKPHSIRIAIIALCLGIGLVPHLYANSITLDTSSAADLGGTDPQYPWMSVDCNYNTDGSLQSYNVTGYGSSLVSQVTWNVQNSQNCLTVSFKSTQCITAASEDCNPPDSGNWYEWSNLSLRCDSITLSSPSDKNIVKCSFNTPDGGTTILMLGSALAGLGLFVRRERK